MRPAWPKTAMKASLEELKDNAGHIFLGTNASIAPGDVLRIKIWFRDFHGDLGSSGFFYGNRKVDGRLYEGLWTDLQPTGARTVFPCIDQPEYKATFKVSQRSSPGAILKSRKEWFSCKIAIRLGII